MGCKIVNMKRIKEFKPCEELTPADFERHPAWTFDLARAEKEPEADETWVRPATFRNPPKDTDVLFIRAELKTAEGTTIPGSLLVRFEAGKAQVQALVALRPRYLALGLDSGRVADWAKKELRKSLPKALKWFPIAYRAVLRAGSREITFTGQAG